MTQFFWVNQGSTHKDEVTGGCLWAPERFLDGSKLVHWESMTLVQPGDVIFAYANGHLRGYAIATSAAAPMARPYTSGAPYSPAQGGRVVFCKYVMSTPPVPFAVIAADPVLMTALSGGANAVINSAGKVAQKYLCLVSHSAGSRLSTLLGIAPPGPATSPPAAPLAKTTVQQLIDARLGQGKFRTDLLANFGSRCPVTGLAEPKLLRASHIRPWSESSNADRLDPENGLLLAAGLDAAFDCGFVGFDDSGALLVKPGFPVSGLMALGIPEKSAIPPAFLTAARLAQLAYHRVKFSL